MGLLNLFFSLHGRIGRTGFWMGLIGLSIVTTALAAYALGEVFRQPYDALQPAALAKPAQQLLALASIILLYPLTAVVAKRLHDRGRSAWSAVPIVLAGLVPAMTVLSGLTGRVGAVLSGLGSPLEIIGVALYGLLLLVILIDLGMMPGQEGVNRFGPDPRAR